MGRKERWKRREDREETERKEKGSEERDKKEDRERERERERGGGGGSENRGTLRRELGLNTGMEWDQMRLD